MKPQLLLIILFALIVCSCGADTTVEPTAQKEERKKPATDQPRKVKVDHDEIIKIISSIKSPLDELSVYMSFPSAFENKLLNPIENISNYNSSYKRAINLGIYGTDLIYTNIYNESEATSKYLLSAKKLADELRIHNYYDFDKIHNLLKQDDNLDSLIKYTLVGFQKMKNDLIDNNRTKARLYMLIGSWTESLYFLTYFAVLNPTDKLNQIIKGQSKNINKIISLLRIYENDKQCQMLAASLKELAISFEYAILKDKYSKEQMVVLHENIKTLRNEIIS